MQGKSISRREKFVDHLQAIDLTKLESAARTYMWLAEFGPEVTRALYGAQRDAVMREFQRRDITPLLDRIRRELRPAGSVSVMRAV